MAAMYAPPTMVRLVWCRMLLLRRERPLLINVHYTSEYVLIYVQYTIAYVYYANMAAMYAPIKCYVQCSSAFSVNIRVMYQCIRLLWPSYTPR